jgi:hypothetical protein
MICIGAMVVSVSFAVNPRFSYRAGSNQRPNVGT